MTYVYTTQYLTQQIESNEMHGAEFNDALKKVSRLLYFLRLANWRHVLH